MTGLHDIFYHILSHLAPDPKALSASFNCETTESRSNRKALACLARTHSSFTELALAEMWRSLPSQKVLEHLLCVVGIVQRPPAGERHRPDLELCGTPTTHEAGWTRFQEYVALVREIIVDPLRYSRDIDMEMLEDTFWCQLFAAFGGMPILPHLEGGTVRSSNTFRPIDMGVLRLLNPCIRTLDIAFPFSLGKELKQLGKALTIGFSSIQHLEVLSMEVPDLTPFLDLETLPKLHPHLCSLTLRRGAPIKLNQLRPLATLPDLEYLSIKLFPWDTEAPNLAMRFPALRSLTVSCGQLALIGSLLDHMDAPQLHSFSIIETHRDSENMVQDFSCYLRTLVAKCPSLTAFEWHSRQSWIRRMGFVGQRLSSAPLAELLAPLLSHRTLRHFAVSFWGPVVPYTPADFNAIMEAWPDLETFEFSDETRHGDEKWVPEQYADLESVVAFACHCPRLRSLHLPKVQFDRTFALAGELARRAPVRHWLRELSVDRFTCLGEEDRPKGERYREDAVEFRGLMQRLFPSAAMPRLG